MAAALTATSGRTGLAPELLSLASPEQLHEAIGWGLAIRLCRRINIPSRSSLTFCELVREDGRLLLRFARDAEAFANGAITNDLAILADWLGLPHGVDLPRAI